MLRSAFESYLSQKFDGDTSRIDSMLSRAEVDVPAFVRDSFGTELNSIYEITDPHMADNLREAIINNPLLRSVDRSLDEPSYTEALRSYRRFLQSSFNPLRTATEGPVPVPGETPSSNDPEEEQFVETTEVTPGESLHHEGAEVQLDHVTTHERNKEARKECIDYYKSLHNGHIVCECCGFDFSKAYYEIGEDFIEVHHLHPVSQRGGDYVVNPKVDLVPLCSNCHSMIHRIGGQGDCMSLEDLKVRYIGKLYIND